MRGLLPLCAMAAASLCAQDARRIQELAEAARASQEASARAAQASVEKQVLVRTAMEQSLRLHAEGAQSPKPAVPNGAAFFLTLPEAAAACPPLPRDYAESLVARAAEKSGVQPAVLRAVAEQESGFRPCALSGKGALGLMQLMPGTAAELGVADPFDPEENMFAGARFLKQLLARYAGNLSLALGAYNAGPARVDAADGIPPIPETLRYVDGILEKSRSEPAAQIH